MSISGLEPAKLTELWCSDTQKRVNPSFSTSCASVTVCEIAWAAVLPSEIGDWSKTLNLIIDYTSQT